MTNVRGAFWTIVVAAITWIGTKRATLPEQHDARRYELNLLHWRASSSRTVRITSQRPLLRDRREPLRTLSGFVQPFVTKRGMGNREKPHHPASLYSPFPIPHSPTLTPYPYSPFLTSRTFSRSARRRPGAP